MKCESGNRVRTFLFCAEVLRPVSAGSCNAHLFEIWAHDVLAMINALQPAGNHGLFIRVIITDVFTVGLPIVAGSPDACARA